MFQEPIDLRDESLALYDLIAARGDDVFDVETQFKRWSINAVLTHLHFWNIGADLAFRDAEAFKIFYAPVSGAVAEGRRLGGFETAYLNGVRGRELLESWRSHVVEMTERFAAADPKQRVQWAGPDMSLRSSVSARLMETWAHGQAVYDALGVERVDHDRIKSIAVLGVNTFAWSFANRRMEVPRVAPHVRLTAPSGALWTWNDPNSENMVEGSATEFCQVVAQVRNIADVGLRVAGDSAARWMAMAQCFAGAPHPPPKPGTRFLGSPWKNA